MQYHKASTNIVKNYCFETWIGTTAKSAPRHCPQRCTYTECELTSLKHFFVWNDVTAAILWRHIKNPNFLEEQSWTNFVPIGFETTNSCWAFLNGVAPITRTRRRTRLLAPWDQFLVHQMRFKLISVIIHAWPPKDVYLIRKYCTPSVEWNIIQYVYTVIACKELRDRV